MEKRATVEDLMYAAVLEKFLSLGVNMLGNMDNILEKVRRFASHQCRLRPAPCGHYRTQAAIPTKSELLSFPVQSSCSR